MSDQPPSVITLGPSGILSAAQFRQLIPAFANSAKYTDEALGLNLTLAASMLDPNRWQDWRPLGMALMVAHWTSLEAREEAIAARGGIPGQGGVGILSSKSIGGISASYDVASGSEQGGGNWNLTTYGRKYYHMMRLVGAGGVQVTGSFTDGAPNPLNSGVPIF